MLKTERIIGICVAKMQDDTRQLEVQAICQNAKKQGYHVMVFNMFNQLYQMNSFSLGEAKLLKMVPMDRLSALIVFAESFQNTEVLCSLVQRAKETGLPVISIGRRIEGCYNVMFAYEESFEKLVRHIVEFHGCRSINFMAGFEANEFSDARIRIFQRVLAENGIAFEESRLAYGQFWEMPARRNCEQWVTEWEKGTQTMPEAIICVNDIMALTVCNVLMNHGIRIPEDILVTGFDGLGLVKYFTPRLTTAADDVGEIGSEVLNIVKYCTEEKNTVLYDIQIPFRVNYAQSCGCEQTQPCNLNEQIMELYGKAAEMRIRSTDTFFMMTVLTDGYSAVDMADKLREYQNMIGVRSMLLLMNQAFYSDTDIPSENFEEGSLLLLVQIQDGVYSTPFQEIPLKQEYGKIYEMLTQEEQLLFIPLHWQEESYGFMVVSYEDSMKDIGAFYEFVLSFQQVLGTIRKQSQLHHMYVTDSLTKLYNRRGFYSELERRMQLLKEKERFIFIVSADMDSLKYINDTYGHAEGDNAIRTVAELLSRSVKEHDGFCARYGGDEYAVAVVSEKEKADIAFYDVYNQGLQRSLQEYNRNSGKPYQLGISIGAVYGSFQTISDVDELMKKADHVMYSQKSEHYSYRGARVRDRGRES